VTRGCRICGCPCSDGRDDDGKNGCYGGIAKERYFPCGVGWQRWCSRFKDCDKRIRRESDSWRDNSQRNQHIRDKPKINTPMYS